MTVEALTAADHAGAASALTNAFVEDPMMTYLAADAARRRTMLPVYFDAVLRQSAAAGVHRTVRDDTGVVRGAAIAMPPGTYPLPLLPQLVEWRTMAASGWRATVRHMRDVPAIDARRPREPYWYLMYIGVDPVAQGHGHGAALIEPVLADADRDGLPAYLVTMKQANLAWYARFGFAVREQLRMGKQGPATWTMMRPSLTGS